MSDEKVQEKPTASAASTPKDVAPPPVSPTSQGGLSQR